MDGNQFFETYNFVYHDGTVSNVRFEGDDMVLTVIRCPMKLESKEDENSLYQRLRFKNVTDFWLWNEDKKFSDSTEWESMWKPVSKNEIEEIYKEDVYCWIQDAFFDNGRVVYDYLMRFACDDIEILESRTNPDYFS